VEILMIHNIRKEFFDLELENYRLTFDDGLFSQYYYYPLFRKFANEPIFFIAPSFIQPGKARSVFDGEQHLGYAKSKKYMYDAFISGVFHHFMTIEEIQRISEEENVKIGAHSHFHDVILTRRFPHKKKPLSRWKLERYPYYSESMKSRFSIRSKLAFQGYEYHNGRCVQRSEAEWLDYIKYDTETCLKWFEKCLGFTPTMYCFPFNEYNERLISSLKSFGFNEFYNARPGTDGNIYPRLDIDKLYDQYRLSAS